MFLCLECTIFNRFLVWCYYFGKIVTLWFYSPTHGNKLNREKYVNLLSSANKDVSIVNLTEKWTQSSVKEVLSNFLIAKAILTSENSCESCTWIAKKMYYLQQQIILRKINRIFQMNCKTEKAACISWETISSAILNQSELLVLK